MATIYHNLCTYLACLGQPLMNAYTLLQLCMHIVQFKALGQTLVRPISPQN